MSWGGARITSLETKIKRFWLNVNKKKNNQCWEWKRSCNKGGYGKVKFNGKHDLAHRVAYQLTKGEIPAGLKVLHKCDNPPCCNPDHLFLGTSLDNVLDALAKNRWPVGENHAQHRLTNRQVKEIRKRFANERVTKKQLAFEYKVTDVMIGKIIRYERWKSI